MLLVCAALLLLAGIGAAAAEIRIDISRYQDGKLVIHGQTDPGRTVILDGKYETETDHQGYFSFSVDEKPASCMSDIRAGDDVYSAVIAGCLNPGVVERLRPLSPTVTDSR